MKTRTLFLTTIFLLAALLSGCAGVAFAQTSTPTETAPATESNRTLSVSGSGLAYLTPDIAYVNIGVHGEGANAAETLAENNERSAAVVAAIKRLGVAEKDIQTRNFSIYPQPQYDPNGQPTGKITYIVENTVFVTVRDLGKIGQLLDEAVKAGANNIGGISFDVADKSAALSEARKAAVENAQAKAEELAQAAGVTLGSVQTISEYSSYPAPVMEGRGGAMYAVDASSVPVSPGQMTITVEVNIVYQIQ